MLGEPGVQQRRRLTEHLTAMSRSPGPTAHHPEISEVVAVGVPDVTRGEVIKAIVVRRPGSSLAADAVSTFAEKQLGSYKKPRIVEFVDALPVTPTGKVDRHAAAGLKSAPRA